MLAEAQNDEVACKSLRSRNPETSGLTSSSSCSRGKIVKPPEEEGTTETINESEEKEEEEEEDGEEEEGEGEGEGEGGVEGHDC